MLGVVGFCCVRLHGPLVLRQSRLYQLFEINQVWWTVVLFQLWYLKSLVLFWWSKFFLWRILVALHRNKLRHNTLLWYSLITFLPAWEVYIRRGVCWLSRVSRAEDRGSGEGNCLDYSWWLVYTFLPSVGLGICWCSGHQINYLLQLHS